MLAYRCVLFEFHVRWQVWPVLLECYRACPSWHRGRKAHQNSAVAAADQCTSPSLDFHIQCDRAQSPLGSQSPLTHAACARATRSTRLGRCLYVLLTHATCMGHAVHASRSVRICATDPRRVNRVNRVTRASIARWLLSNHLARWLLSYWPHVGSPPSTSTPEGVAHVSHMWALRFLLGYQIVT